MGQILVGAIHAPLWVRAPDSFGSVFRVSSDPTIGRPLTGTVRITVGSFWGGARGHAYSRVEGCYGEATRTRPLALVIPMFVSHFYYNWFSSVVEVFGPHGG